MPFVLRTVQPVYVSRAKLTGPDGKPLVQDGELEAVFNGTLCCAIRQLSSLLEAADDLFAGLTKEMTCIAERATSLQQRVRRIQDRVDAHDPKLVTVPEGDLTAFSALPRDAHFHPAHLREPAKALFLADSRPAAVQRLYAAAARPTLDNEALAQLDKLRKDGARSSTLFLCTPTLGRTRAQRLRKKVVDIDIETRKPASVVELRRWTSTEALGDMTVHPDCTVRIAGRDADDAVDGVDASLDASEYLGVDSTLRPGDESVDHQLPTTEEQVKAIADRFPPEVVKVDVTGKPFTRMSRYRRSLLYPGAGGAGGGGAAATEEEEVARRRTRPRRQRSRRRNTIAGTDQKEIEEALNGDRTAAASTLATVDDIILSSSTMLNGNPKSARETTADFKKWAFNSLRRWGRSRFRAIGSSNTSTSSNMVSGELHTADPVDDINVYETVAGKRRGAGNIPISAGLSGPMSLAVKLREGSLGQRRLKINDEPPHSSSGNWSASSESGRASVNSDSSHHPKSSTCSSILPHRRRFINNSTSSSVTSEGTLTPEDMAAAPFADDGETSSVYSCDTEGYYTSFHMDSGLKTLKEEEIGFSLPPTPLHSTSALSNCSSGRGSASLAQLTAESEYELFGKGSTSTTASSAGTVCTTLLADHSRGGDNSLGSDRSLSKGPTVPERKSSLNVPCLAQECPPCSTVVALIHNTSQGHSPRSISGDSPDSGHNTSSSPVESMSCPQDAETDALISPIPSLTSEMEFSECSDFEGMDRIERIRVKTTINTSRIPSMCAITPPQSDDETSLRQFSESGSIQNTSDLPRAPAPLPYNIHQDANQNSNRNDNYSFNENGGIHLIDNNANKHSVDNNCNARQTIPLTNTSGRSIIQTDKNSGYATIQSLDNACKENNINQKVRPPSPSGGTLFINTKAVEEESSFSHQPFIKDALIPFTSMLSKFRKATNGGHNKSIPKTDDSTKEDNLDESGEYVTITDVKNNNKPDPATLRTPQRSEIPEPVRESNINKTWESLEYVSLNEIPTNPSDLHSPDVLSGSSNESSLERRKRQGARVTLDSEGKVVYSSDSLRRRKGAHTTFAPGQHVKDPSVSPSPSPVANHRTPKAIIRPVQQQGVVNSDDSWSKSPLKSNIRSSMSGTLSTSIGPKSDPAPSATSNQLNGFNPRVIGRSPAPLPTQKDVISEPQKATTPAQLSDPTNQRNRVIIRAGVGSPTKELTKSLSPMRSLSPRSVAVPRGAYVQMPPDRRMAKTHSAYLQTDFDGPEDPVKAPEGISPPKLFRDSLHHTYHPIPRSAEQIASAHPVYQNVSSLHRNQPSTNQMAAFPNQYRLLGTGASPNRFTAEGSSMTGQPIEAPLHSSTPTKTISSLVSPLSVGNSFSPIEKDVSQSSKRFSYSDSKFSSVGKEDKQSGDLSQQGMPERENRKSSLVSLPKTTMTSEELYAKIHKSKKQMNIKFDPEIVLSPTPSACGSQSPVSSERSASPNEPKGGARSRHSWSPNSSKYLDIVSSFDPRSNTPSPNPQLPKEHGLTQVTSTHDFKRLLLQHGSGTAGKSKLSAVERLKQAKQAATNVFTNNTAKLRFTGNSGGESNGANAPRLVGHPPPSKAPSKPSLMKPGPKYAWRFAGHKNDVRSTPILEDQREYENIVVPDVLQIQTLSSSPMPARNLGRSLAHTRQFPQNSTEKTSSHPIYSEPHPPALPPSQKVQPPAAPAQVPQLQHPSVPSQSKFTPNNKQPRVGSGPVLPTRVEEFNALKSGKKSPTALETAL